MSRRARQLVAAILILGGLYGVWLAALAIVEGGHMIMGLLVLGFALIVFVLSVVAGLLVGSARPGGDVLALTVTLAQLPVVDTDLFRYGLHIGAEVSVGVSTALTVWLSAELGSGFQLAWRPSHSQGRVGVNLVAAGLLYLVTARRGRPELPTQGGLVTR